MNNTIKLESKYKEPELAALKDDLLKGYLDGVSMELDFSAVEKPDMRSIQLLMSWSNSVQEAGGEIKTTGVSEGLHNYFKMTGTSADFS